MLPIVSISGVRLSLKIRQKEYFVSSAETVLIKRLVLSTENKAAIALVLCCKEEISSVFCACVSTEMN